MAATISSLPPHAERSLAAPTRIASNATGQNHVFGERCGDARGRVISTGRAASEVFEALSVMSFLGTRRRLAVGGPRLGRDRNRPAR